ncbi:hypothetical protein ABXW19_11780, partial [Streptococcus suis]|uniref:hypothetical protein n=1 Tax=Streptococcus suis TaxID=1307 RepID=UPI003CF9030A
RQRSEDVEKGAGAVILVCGAIEQARPPGKRSRHANKEADGEQRDGGECDGQVERLVVLGAEGALPEACRM